MITNRALYYLFYDFGNIALSNSIYNGARSGYVLHYLLVALDKAEFFLPYY